MKIRIYVACVVVAAALLGGVAVPRAPAPRWGLVVLFGILIQVSEWSALTTPYGGTVSVSFALVYAALLLGGPVTAAGASLFAAVTPQDIVRRKPLYRVVFNAAQYLLVVFVPTWVLFLLDPSQGIFQRFSDLNLMTWLAPAVLVAVLMATTNWILVGAAIALSTGVSLGEVWRSEFRLQVGSFSALSLLGLVLVQLVNAAGALSILLLTVPFFVARGTLRVYQQLASAFRDTIRSLVEVLEAKDPYTRGHSERVAVYARQIAEAMGLPASAIREVELAALLHDIGKVGIPSATLGKADSLTSDEFEQVRLHPITGSSILADIDFLADVVPIIAAHHERLDGSGYPYSLKGEAVPIEARILAVADCFDAMTSNRAYRAALSDERAREELLLGAGRKLDSRCVAALLSSISAGRDEQPLTCPSEEVESR